GSANTDKFDIVIPSLSVLAEPSVAVVDKNAEAKGNATLALEYLKFLYSKEGQTIAAKNYYRPRDAEVAKAYAKNFPALQTFTIDEFGGWAKAQPEHFGDGGIFDKIYTNK
ncbi:MAG TPA: sulfate transporter subunit, partial [Cellvibrionaceae bacterium]|nr:sulfate transporter subunit [Cellvibrionaceae bacterium]